jgi:hypoxanthine-DNA glycosylase
MMIRRLTSAEFSSHPINLLSMQTRWPFDSKSFLLDQAICYQRYETMPRIQSFQPVASEEAKILILGSMPGSISLAANEYYANPQNAFWRIIAALLGFDFSAPYTERIAALKLARIALWDVLQSCTREGSLDMRIDRDTAVANDFAAFFDRYPAITHVFFNGAMAEACFKRHVLRKLTIRSLHYARLPSTSPANASMTLANKSEAWQLIMIPLKQTISR